MDFEFDWNYVSSGAPYVTISKLGLSLNLPAINMLGNPENVAIGFDSRRMAIGIRESNENDSSKTYKFASRVRNGWIRIGCKDFIKYLSILANINFDNAKKYVARFDAEKRILYILIDDKSDIKEE